MRKVFYDMPKRNTWNSIHYLAEVMSDLNLGQDVHSCVSYNFNNHLQQYYVTSMLTIEYILHPILKGQHFIFEQRFLDDIKTSKNSFHTTITTTTPYTDEDFKNNGFSKLLTLTQTLSGKPKVWYKTNRLIIIMDNLTWSDLFKIIALKYSLMKNQNDDFEPNDDLMEMYKAFVNNNPSEANTYFNKIMDTEAYKNMYNKQFEQFFKIDYQKEIKEYQNTLQHYKRDLASYLKRYAETETKINELNDLITLYNDRPTIDCSKEVLAYITKNPYITRMAKSGPETLKLFFEAPILYYAKDVVAKLKESTSSKFKKALYKVFLDEKYTLWTRCCVEFNTRTFSINAFPIGSNNMLIGHPHIDQFRCTGNHPKEITEWIKNKDYIGAITQVSAAALNLNFYDSYVVDRLCEHLDEDWNDIPTFKNNETGEMVSLNQIFEGEA